MPPASTLSGWTLISLRPRHRHGAIRRAAAAQGARVLAISPYELLALDAGAALQEALHCPIRIASSPAAVAFAAAQADLHGDWLAIGEATAKALRRAGANAVQSAEPQNADGLLAMPILSDGRGQDIGLITAPDGRGLLESALPARGAHLHIAHVYCRHPLEMPASMHRRLQALGQNTAVLVSSRAAFAEFWRQLDDAERDKISRMLCIASSARLLEYLQELGIRQLRLAAGTQPAAMLAALGEAIAAHEREG
jgi:uroporphyrinogen-III synthase